MIDLAEHQAAGAGLECAIVVTVVEHAEHVDIRIVLGLERRDELLAVLVGADDDGPPVEPALPRPTANHRAQEQPFGGQYAEAGKEERRKPQP